MRISIKVFALVCSAICLFPASAGAQLSKNPNKFLGNITTRYQVDAGGGVPSYYTLWNQITPENESKWGSVEGTRGRFNWGSDTPFNYAKSHNFTYKFHALVWGAQYPSWFSSNLSVTERYNAIVNWFDEVKKHYPDLPMIDVVNEAVGMHQQGNPLMKESLGGEGQTGYDWLINAFEMAHERWPDAILIYNDYNTFQYDTDAYIDLVRTLRDAGAPIDAYGCQSHDVDNISKSNLQNSMARIQDAVKMPMYITELDINVQDDNQQKAQYESIFPVMWEADYCAGVTIWGYVYGATWVDHSGLYRNGSERPAMTWLKQYMATDAAKNAKSPFPGMKKPISLYIKPGDNAAIRGESTPITIRARLTDSSKTIDNIKFYVNNQLYTTLTEAPYVVDLVPTTTGKQELKAVVYDSDGNKYERYGSITAYEPRAAYKSVTLPGTIQAENFDEGIEGVAYHDNDRDNQGGQYRSNSGVDIVSGNNGYVIGYTENGEWLEYTVNVKTAGYYNYELTASTPSDGTGVILAVNDNNNLTQIADRIEIPNTGAWDTYKTVCGRTRIALKEGTQIIRMTINGISGNNCNIDKIALRHAEIDSTLNLIITPEQSPTTINTNTKIYFTPQYADREDAIKNVKVYVDGILYKTLTKKPFEAIYRPAVKGQYLITAIAIDTLKNESAITSMVLKANNKRAPHTSNSKPTILPGLLQVEDFDIGGESTTFHDSDETDQGKTGYRSDNEGVDIIKANGGNYVLSYTAVDEWLEYSVNVQSAGTYSYSATVSSGEDNAGFRISLMKDGQEITLANVDVPNNGKRKYAALSGDLIEELEEGEQIIRITITGANCNIDNIEFTCTTGVSYITPDDMNAPGTRYNLGGVRVNEYQRGITIMNGKKVLIME